MQAGVRRMPDQFVFLLPGVKMITPIEKLPAVPADITEAMSKIAGAEEIKALLKEKKTKEKA